MAEQQLAQSDADQSEQVVAILGDIAERSRKLVEDFLARQQDLDGTAHGLDRHAQLGGAFLEMLTHLMSHPHELMQAQFGLWQDYVRLWQSTTQRMMGAERRAGDRRPIAATAGSRTPPGTTTRCSTSSSSPTS